MTIPAELLAALPPYAVVRPHPTSPSLYLLTRAFICQTPNPRIGRSRIEFPTETRILDSAGTDLGAWDGESPWVVRQVTDETGQLLPAVQSAVVTVQTPSGPATVPLPLVYLALATLFRQWWDEDRAAETPAPETP